MPVSKKPSGQQHGSKPLNKKSSDKTKHSKGRTGKERSRNKWPSKPLGTVAAKSKFEIGTNADRPCVWTVSSDTTFLGSHSDYAQNEVLAAKNQMPSKADINKVAYKEPPLQNSSKIRARDILLVILILAVWLVVMTGYWR